MFITEEIEARNNPLGCGYVRHVNLDLAVDLGLYCVESGQINSALSSPHPDIMLLSAQIIIYESYPLEPWNPVSSLSNTPRHPIYALFVVGAVYIHTTWGLCRILVIRSFGSFKTLVTQTNNVKKNAFVMGQSWFSYHLYKQDIKNIKNFITLISVAKNQLSKMTKSAC